jgi:replicative DNA helicase
MSKLKSLTHASTLVKDALKLPKTWSLCACNGNKVPIGNEWEKTPLSSDDFVKAQQTGIFEKLTIRPDTKPEFNPPFEWCKSIGVHCGIPSGGLLFLDHDGMSCDRFIEEISGLDLKEALPKTPLVTSGRKGRYQLVYQVPEMFWPQIKTTKKKTGETGDDGKPEMLEFRWTGAQSIVLGAHPMTKGYQWLYHPEDVAIAEAPVWMVEQMLIPEHVEREIIEAPAPIGAIPLASCCSVEIRNALEGKLIKGRNDTGFDIASELVGVSSYLYSIGQPFDGNPERIFFDWCTFVGLDTDIPKGQPESIWRSANKKNPDPVLSPEYMENCIKGWYQRQIRERRRENISTPTEEGVSEDAVIECGDSEAEKLRCEIKVLAQEEDPFKRVFLENSLSKNYKVSGRRLDELTDALIPKLESEFTYLDKLGANVFAQLEARAKSPTVPGLRTGFPSLDDLTDGLNPGDLIVVAARPSMGKTAFVLNIARKAAEINDVAVSFFSLEMSKEQLHYRMISTESSVPSGSLRRGEISSKEFQKISSAIGVLSGIRIGIDDGCSLTIEDIERKIDKFAIENPSLGLVIIDYLQIMESDYDNRNFGIAKITRRLKAIAKRFNIPVVVLSQLSRAVEQRNDKRPMLSDLRDSGGIEQDADIVMFLYRDEYYNPDSIDRGTCEVIIAKNRNGPIGTAKLLFEPELVKFHDSKASTTPLKRVVTQKVFDEDGYEYED